MSGRWENKPVDAVLKELQTSRKGLNSRQVQRRLADQGPNRLEEAERVSLAELFAQQFQDLMVIVLLAATVISALLGETVDAVAILAIVFLNAILGFVQEYRAERSLEALKKMTAPTCTVIRKGRMVTVPAAELVPGDIVILNGGDRVPADCRLLTASALQADESALTGESVPVSKDASWTSKGEVALAERRNMVFMGTVITQGRAEAVVVATGMDTEIGQIAELMQSSQEELTPLQQRLEQLGRWLLAACLVVVAVVFAAGVLQGFSPYRMFLTAVSLAVAAIPEGLPAVVTIALALGVQRMIRRNAIIRRLPAVETLGCATVICSDKTGTLTQNEMTVRRYWFPGGEVQVTGSGYEPQGKFLANGQEIEPRSDNALHTALLTGAICNHAELIEPAKTGLLRRRKSREESRWKVIGDPTEGALLAAAQKAGIRISHLQDKYRLVSELPFDSDRKRMTVVTSRGGRMTGWVKGAPDVVVGRCTRILAKGQARPLSAAEKRRILAANERMAAGALRVLALAYKPLPSEGWKDTEELEKGLVFVGLVGMIDPPRPEVRSAVQLARRAGIRTIMVTGDHRATALAIARELGLTSGQAALTGAELDGLDDDELEAAVASVNVFARVSPRHKLRIVRALRRQGEVVAMTGDGVNDAPAVKEADIGVSMGRTGTDVTKEASDMVLADDNYSTIVAAVEEGRGIYDNIRKFIRYLLACNVGEVLTMFIATVAGMAVPLVPIQILWMNLVTDGLPAIALGVDPPDADVMKRPPRSPREGVFARGLHLKIVFRGALIGVCTVAVFWLSLFVNPEDLGRARTLAFTTLVMSQLFYVFQCRSERRSVFEVGFLTNPYLVLAVAVSLLMQLAVIYVPQAQVIFKTVRLDAMDWALVLIFSGWGIVVDGLIRGLRRTIRRRLSVFRANM